MRQPFDDLDEELLREEFLDSLSIRAVYQRRSQIRRACHWYREAFPDDSILNHTHTTVWAATWRQQVAHLAPATRVSLLWSLSGWWAWLFDERLIDANVLDLVSCEKLAVEDLPPLVLRCNLQRLIDEHLTGLKGVSDRSRASYRVWLNRFNVFINRLPEGACLQTDRLDLREEVLVGWFQRLCRDYERVTVLQGTFVLSRFFDTLVRKNTISDNPLERLRDAFPMGKRLGVAYALGSDDPDAALASLARPPMFRSVLVDHLDGFLTLKRATGCRYPHAIAVLRDFDRFLVDEAGDGHITSPLLGRWHRSRPDLSPATHRIRWNVIRQFCVYLQRYRPETYIPDPLLGRRPIPRLKPHIVQPTMMRALLDGVAAVAPGSRFALRPHTYSTLLTLLYTTGLRISEALALCVADIDFDDRLMVIRESKFAKSRIVPFSDGLLEVLEKYHRARQALLGRAVKEAPFFVTQYGRALLQELGERRLATIASGHRAWRRKRSRAPHP